MSNVDGRPAGGRHPSTRLRSGLWGSPLAMTADCSERMLAGRYALQRLLGRGGMGSVWLARDELLGRDVAVKEITFPVSLTDDERRSLRERTLREARAAARFEHPQVTTVHDVVEEDGRPWIVMEHVPSRTLSELVHDKGPLPSRVVARIGLDVLAALSAAHRAGIVHRDVKPANILVSEQGRAWLTDFGIATTTGDEHLTGHGVLLGSPPYMAPERARGEQPGPPADLWALGATLFTAVEGRPAFERGEAMATLLAVTSEEPPPTERAGRLAPVLRGLLTRDPTARMQAEQARLGLADALTDVARTDVTLIDVAPAAAVALSPPAGGGQGLGDRVERFDVDELAAFAATATRALAGSAARTVARTKSRRRHRQAPVIRPDTVAVGKGQPKLRKRRFKRRWVLVPLLASISVVLALVGAGAWLLAVLLSGR